MFCKAGIILITLLVGSNAFPLDAEQDMSIFFDHSETSSRIVNGVPAGSVPHMVALTTGAFRGFHCGGSLISTQHVLTAAHCINGAYVHGGLVRTLSGTVGSNRWNSGGFQYGFTRNITHPNYIRDLIKNDISILVTTNSVVLSNSVRIVPLSHDFVGANVPVHVNGWGRTRHGGYISATLVELRSYTVDGNRCIEDVRRRALEIDMEAPAVQPDLEICVFVDATKGTCHGDSGSPLIRQDNGHQIGVVSWGLPCARGAPDMFARVSTYLSWIEQIIN